MRTAAMQTEVLEGSIVWVCNITQSQLLSTTGICLKHFTAVATVGPVSCSVTLSGFSSNFTDAGIILQILSHHGPGKNMSLQ